MQNQTDGLTPELLETFLGNGKNVQAPTPGILALLAAVIGGEKAQDAANIPQLLEAATFLWLASCEEAGKCIPKVFHDEIERAKVLGARTPDSWPITFDEALRLILPSTMSEIERISCFRQFLVESKLDIGGVDEALARYRKHPFAVSDFATIAPMLLNWRKTKTSDSRAKAGRKGAVKRKKRLTQQKSKAGQL